MQSFTQFYFRHKKLFLLAFACLAVLFIFHFPHAAHAVEDPETAKLLSTINRIINMFLRAVSAILWPVLLMIGSLLDNDLIFGGAMGEKLQAVWVQIRNIVNILFVLVLLAIALYNILPISGEESGTLAFKTAMPKFVIALVAVNFSFLAIKVVLDFTNVMTGAVFALPGRITEQNYTKTIGEFESTICGTTSDQVPFQAMWCDKSQKKFNDRANSFFSRLNRSNITVIYAMKFGHAVELKFIREGLKDLGQLGFNIIFNTVLFVVYALSFVALFLVLLFRVVAMWIAVVLSPLLALSIAVPQLKELAGSGGELQQKFVKSLIAPITIGLILSVGYIMLDAFDVNVHGELLGSSTIDAIDINSVPTGITDLQQLMVAIATVVIVWTGVFGATKGTFAEAITETIRSKAVDFGKWTAKLPTYFQAIPTGGKFGSQSVASLMKTGTQIPQMLERSFGQSIWEQGTKTDAATLAKFSGAISMRELGKVFAENVHALNTDDGWNAVKERMVKFGAMTDDESKVKYKDKNQANQLIADKLAQHVDFQEGMRGSEVADLAKGPTENEADYAKRIVKAIEKRPPPEIKDSKTAVAAIQEATPKELSDHPAFADIVKADPNAMDAVKAAFDKLKDLPEAIRTGLVEYDAASGKATFKASIPEITAMGNLANELRGSSATTIDAIITKYDAVLNTSLAKPVAAHFGKSHSDETVKAAINAKINPPAGTP